MRKLKRNVAKTRMRARGIRKMFKKGTKGSYFSQHWREYV